MVRATQAHVKQLRRAVHKDNAPWNETIWNYVAAVILCAAQDRGEAPAWFENQGPHAAEDGNTDVWCEAIPIAPRCGAAGRTEGNSHIDIAWGAITIRNGTKAGIAFDPDGGGSVTFVEAKLLSDISTGVSHDPVRNQMARVIESLACLQTDDGHGALPEDIRFALLTPKRLRDEYQFARLYGYKYEAYIDTRDALIADINASWFERRNTRRWHYPEGVPERLTGMAMDWWSYEEILQCDEVFRTFGDELDLLQWAVGGMPPEARNRVEQLIQGE
ncbi:hypothetical protein LLG88_13075 [bacterium]|nr:hypothetical protein [bacterium]